MDTVETWSKLVVGTNTDCSQKQRITQRALHLYISNRIASGDITVTDYYSIATRVPVTFCDWPQLDGRHYPHQTWRWTIPEGKRAFKCIKCEERYRSTYHRCRHVLQCRHRNLFHSPLALLLAESISCKTPSASCYRSWTSSLFEILLQPSLTISWK